MHHDVVLISTHHQPSQFGPGAAAALLIDPVKKATKIVKTMAENTTPYLLALSGVILGLKQLKTRNADDTISVTVYISAHELWQELAQPHGKHRNATQWQELVTLCKRYKVKFHWLPQVHSLDADFNTWRSTVEAEAKQAGNMQHRLVNVRTSAKHSFTVKRREDGDDEEQN